LNVLQDNDPRLLPSVHHSVNRWSGNKGISRSVSIHSGKNAGIANEAAQLELCATKTGAKISTFAPENRWFKP
jgi:hypothetical protein